MKLISFSGGATKIPGLLGVAEAFVSTGVKPDILAGVSSGAITAAIYGMGLTKQSRDLIMNMTLDTIFDIKPVNKKGKFTLCALWRLINGKSSLGRMGSLEKLMRQVITQDLYEAYQDTPSTPPVLVMAVNFSDGSRKLWNLKEEPYELGIKAIMASCSIPVMAEPVEIEGKFYFDGGLRDHNPIIKILEDFSGITKAIGVYSRPEDHKILPSTFKRKIFPILTRSVDILNLEVSKSDELMSLLLSEREKIEMENIFLPAVMHHLYDTDPVRIKKLNQEGYLAGLDCQLAKKF